MIGGQAANFSGHPKEFITAGTSAAVGFMHRPANQSAFRWKPDYPSLANDPGKQVLPIPSVAPHQFHLGVVLPTGIPGPVASFGLMPGASSVPLANPQTTAHLMSSSIANGVDRIKEGIEKLIQLAASQLSDQLPESREAASALLLELQNVYVKTLDMPPTEVSAAPQTISWENFCQKEALNCKCSSCSSCDKCRPVLSCFGSCSGASIEF